MAENSEETKERKLREISDEELQKILQEHKKWFESVGMEVKEGEKADLSFTNLIFRNLKEANLFCAKLQKANLSFADLQEANLEGADLQEADLEKANLEKADLLGAKLQKANLRRANLENADVTGVKYDRWGRYRGIRVATCYGSARFKRFAQDQDFIEEFRDSRWRYPIYLLWLILADCGRSLLLWAAWSIFLAVTFGFMYFYMGPDAFHVKWPLPHSLGTMIYYSVVTFTTLGFGDITPKTPAASWWVMTEVVLGYIMLGGLISIFATKLARRS